MDHELLRHKLRVLGCPAYHRGVDLLRLFNDLIGCSKHGCFHQMEEEGGGGLPSVLMCLFESWMALL